MTNPERRISPSINQDFQPVIKYKDIEKSPIMVSKQTCQLLELFYQGAIHKPDLARDYFHDYTLSYLSQAEAGTDALYDGKGGVFKDLDLETREIAHHAFIVFANLPDNVKSPFLPNGFSRRGMLKAPETRKEFLKRIREIKIGIWQILEGEAEPGITLEAYPRLLRTYGFFKVGSKLPIKLSQDEKKKEQMEKEKFEAIVLNTLKSLPYKFKDKIKNLRKGSEQTTPRYSLI